MAKTLTTSDVRRLGEFDKANRFSATHPIAIEYIELNGYRQPSRAWPYSHWKPLLTAKFFKWLETSHPEFAKQF